MLRPRSILLFPCVIYIRVVMFCVYEKATVNGRMYGNRNQATSVINPYLLLVLMGIWLCKFVGLDLNFM
jgi:hypothetical protein